MTKPKTLFITSQKLDSIKKKFSNLKCTASTYRTKYGSLCVLQCFWQNNEKVAQLQDYSYGKVFKDYLANKYYTDYKAFAD